MAKQLYQSDLWETRLNPAARAAGHKDEKTGPMGQTKPPPETDLERMSRVRGLATDPNYPTDEIIEALSDMLARHWYS
jgi:hypothetical protein